MRGYEPPTLDTPLRCMYSPKRLGIAGGGRFSIKNAISTKYVVYTSMSYAINPVQFEVWKILAWYNIKINK